MVGIYQSDLTYGELTHCGHVAEVVLLLKPTVHRHRFVLSCVLPGDQLFGGGLKLSGATGDTFQLALRSLQVERNFIVRYKLFDHQSQTCPGSRRGSGLSF